MEPALTISVNLSSSHFAQPDLVHRIDVVLAETGLAANCLVLELSELILMEDIEQAVARIEQLRALGIGIAIDDFGTEYSSLGYLRHLSVNMLKIDHSFISTLNMSKAGVPIIRAIIAMANSLDMKVIAEGIETEDQAKDLLALECNYGQGFFLRKPLDSGQMQELLKRGVRRYVRKNDRFLDQFRNFPPQF